MAELTKGTRMKREGADKDRRIAKHGRDWRVRTVEVDALATFAPTRGGEETSALGGGYAVTVMLIGTDGKVERGADGKPLPLATVMLPIDADSLGRKGFSSRQKHLETMHRAIDDAEQRRANLAEHEAWRAEMVTLPSELAAETPAEPAPVPVPVAAPAMISPGIPAFKETKA